MTRSCGSLAPMSNRATTEHQGVARATSYMPMIETSGTLVSGRSMVAMGKAPPWTQPSTKTSAGIPFNTHSPARFPLLNACPVTCTNPTCFSIAISATRCGIMNRTPTKCGPMSSATPPPPRFERSMSATLRLRRREGYGLILTSWQQSGIGTMRWTTPSSPTITDTAGTSGPSSKKIDAVI